MIQHRRNCTIEPKDNDDYQRINVRRSHLSKDAFRLFAKQSFNECKMLRVVFVNDPGVDEGGPRREFFRHLTRECFQKSGLFSGYPDHIVPLHNVDAVNKKLEI